MHIGFAIMVLHWLCKLSPIEVSKKQIHSPVKLIFENCLKKWVNRLRIDKNSTVYFQLETCQKFSKNKPK